MNEEKPNREPKIKAKESFDPRAAYDWVPMILVLVAFICGAAVYILPYVALIVNETPDDAQQMLGLIMSIPTNETFNYLLVSLVSFWLGKNVADKMNK